MAETWQAKKETIPEAQQFDWTYSTKYRGCTMKGGAKWDAQPTDEKIDFESLKVFCAPSCFSPFSCFSPSPASHFCWPRISVLPHISVGPECSKELAKTSCGLQT